MVVPVSPSSLRGSVEGVQPITGIPKMLVFVSSREAGELLSCGRSAIHKKIAQGFFKSAMWLYPRAYIIRRDEITAILLGVHADYKVPKGSL